LDHYDVVYMRPFYYYDVVMVSFILGYGVIYIGLWCYYDCKLSL